MKKFITLTLAAVLSLQPSAQHTSPSAPTRTRRL